MAKLRHRRPRMQAEPGGSAEQCTSGHEFASVHDHGAIGGLIAIVTHQTGGLSDLVCHEWFVLIDCR
jgi:hypothetical protein